MPTTEVECSRIVDNIRNIAAEMAELDARERQLISSKEDKGQQLREAESEMAKLVAASSVARAGRASPGSAALSIIGAVALENEKARMQARIDQLQHDLRRIDTVLQQIDSQKYQKLMAIQKSQNDFAGLGCFDLGFSHEVMNLP